MRYLPLTSSAEGGAVVGDPLGVGSVGTDGRAIVRTVLQLVSARLCKTLHSQQVTCVCKSYLRRLDKA